MLEVATGTYNIQLFLSAVNGYRFANCFQTQLLAGIHSHYKQTFSNHGSDYIHDESFQKDTLFRQIPFCMYKNSVSLPLLWRYQTRV